MISPLKTIKVAALGMEQRTYNTLQLFFSDKCANNYVLSDEKSADIYIIDLDGYLSADVLETNRKNHPDRPAILISIKENNIDGTVFVRKPIQLANLTLALDEAQKRIKRVAPAADFATLENDSQLSAQENPPTLYNGVKLLNNTEHPSTQPEKIKYFVNQKRINNIQGSSLESEASKADSAQYKAPIINSKTGLTAANSAMEFESGSNDSGIRFVGDLSMNFNPHNPRLVNKMQYNSELTLQGYFSEAYELALKSKTNVALEGPWRPIVILYKNKEVCVEKNFRHLFALAGMTFKKDEVSINGRRDILKDISSKQWVRQPVEQFVWKLALRTSQGRVPQGTDLGAPVLLNRWPNFTRCDATPHAFRIAALWTRYPTSLVDTATILNIPQQYVFAFYSAAVATNLVSKTTNDTTQEFKPQLIQRHAYRNLFQNILDTLRRF